MRRSPGREGGACVTRRDCGQVKQTKRRTMWWSKFEAPRQLDGYLESRRALALTFFRTRFTMPLAEAPINTRPPSWSAAATFSVTIKRASLWALLPPQASLIVRRQITYCDSTASIVKSNQV